MSNWNPLNSKIFQYSWVVPNIEAAALIWYEELGVGPFTVMRKVEVADAVYRGRGCEAVFSVALAMNGGTQIELIEQIEQAGPFGAGAPAPRFAFPDVEIRFTKRVGETHLKVTFSDGLGARLEAICFGAMDTPLGPALVNPGGKRFHMAGRLEINSWGGRQSPQLRLEDAAPA